MLAEMRKPDSVPAVQGLTIGAAGELWVRRTSRMDAESSRYDVFDAEGAYLGEIVLPGRFDLLEAGLDYLLGVRRNELAVPFVDIHSLDRRSVDARTP